MTDGGTAPGTATGTRPTPEGGPGTAGGGRVPGGRVGPLLARASVPVDDVTGCTPLTGGSYNSLYAVDLAGGDRLVLKVPPPSDRPRLRYEAELLHGEAVFAERAAEVGVPAPRLLRAEPEEGSGTEPYAVMTYCPGRPWSELAEELEAAERDRLRRELGAMVARLHAVPGPGFGYPAQRIAPLSERWETAFGAMAAALLADAERFRPWLPVPLGELRAVFAAAGPDLARATGPALVHFDLWRGNVLLGGPAGSRRITGLIDGERMFWGDPLADFASLSLMDTPPEEDPAFLAGYREAGGRLEWDPCAARRTALYRAYLYLIMLVEVVPRGDSGEHLAFVREFVAPRLTAQLVAATR
ncbi:phosphotransferase family protein [Actinacidiphila yeochonensis]|uniref:phosphotransferase family protein n=1 Tax=Actinacidiphila yeochonensis TaxID=89050 RepID=UPI00099C8BBC|nr:aminoglycoside phosphotransferase family protein [Actinacidiphila yeochonensis]